MRLASLLVAACCLTLPGCCALGLGGHEEPSAPAAPAAAPAESTPPAVQASLGSPFRLSPGQHAEVEGVRVTFDAVVEDSRCPRGAQCIQAGEAVVRVTVSTPENRFSHELRTQEGTDQVFFSGFALKLQDLAPLPVEGQVPDPARASAGFVLSKP